MARYVGNPVTDDVLVRSPWFNKGYVTDPEDDGITEYAHDAFPGDTCLDTYTRVLWRKLADGTWTAVGYVQKPRS